VGGLVALSSFSSALWLSTGRDGETGLGGEEGGEGDRGGDGWANGGEEASLKGDSLMRGGDWWRGGDPNTALVAESNASVELTESSKAIAWAAALRKS